MKVHVKAGKNEFKLPRSEGVESLLVRAGAFTARADFSLEGYAGYDSRSR